MRSVQCGEISTFSISHSGLSARKRFVFENVKRGACDFLCLQGPDDGCLVNDRPAADVYHDSGRLHGGKLFVAE